MTGLSGGFILTMKLIGEKGLYLAQAYMLTPALAAILARRFFHPPRFTDACLRFGNWRDYVRWWAASVGTMALAYLMYTLFGAVEWDWTGETFLKRLSEQMAGSGKDIHDLPAGLTPHDMLVIFFFGGLTVFNLPGIIQGFGEEFGWRGFLFPRLYEIRPWMGFVLGGIIWFAWHLPLALVMPAGTMPVLTAAEMALSAVLSVSAAILAFTFFAYVYVRTKNIWVTSLAHIVQNNTAMAFSLMATVTHPVRGVAALTLTMGIVVGVIWKRGGMRVFEEAGAGGTGGTGRMGK